MKLTAAYLFDWPSRHNVHLALPLFLLLSFLLHGACVLIFQVYYPRSTEEPFRSARVFFLRPGSAESRALAPMLEASDPALFSPVAPFGPDVLTLPGTEYRPGFAGRPPALVGLPESSKEPAKIVVPLRLTADERPQAMTPVQGQPTVVRLSGGLKNRVITPPANFIFSAQPKQVLEPIDFLIAVSPDGRPMHVTPLYPQGSSGVESVDRTALAYLLQSRFDPVSGTSELAWGTGRFLWGADVERRKEP